MKKLAIATAVAAAAMISTGAHASAAIASNVTDIQLYIGYFDVEVPCANGRTTSLALSGANPDTIYMNGQVCLSVGLDVALTFNNLTGRHYDHGSLFTSGTIDIELDTGGGWFYYDTVTATLTDPINCLVDEEGHLGGGATRVNTTFGLQVPPLGVDSPLPGGWNGALAPSDAMNDAVCVTDLFGQRAGLFLRGRISN